MRSQHFKRAKELILKYTEKRTPMRFLTLLENFTSGYSLKSLDKSISTGIVKNKSINHLIFVEDIRFFSLCKHHLMPFYGTVKIAYFPKNLLLGISKFVRIVNHFSRRFQLQEELTQNIANYLHQKLDCPVYIKITATHTCTLLKTSQAINFTTQVFVGDWFDEIRNEVISRT